MSYNFAPPKIDIPVLNEPPVLFGPSFYRAMPVEGGTQHTAVSWVGGKGLASTESRWGKIFSLSFILEKQIDPMARGAELLEENREAIAAVYGADTAAAIIKVIGAAYGSKLVEHPSTIEEVTELFK
jgi:hypothetical protein